MGKRLVSICKPRYNILCANFKIIYAPVAQLDRALVSGTRFCGGSNPSGRAYITSGAREFTISLVLFITIFKIAE